MSELDRRTFLAAMPAIARTASNAAPPLMLAQYTPAGIDSSGYLVSEKHDGGRLLGRSAVGCDFTADARWLRHRASSNG